MFFRAFLALLLCLLPVVVRAEDDLVSRCLDAHAKIQSAEIDASVNVTGDVPFKGIQNITMALVRPYKLLWKSHADMKEVQLDVQICSDGKELFFYNSGEVYPGQKNVYFHRPFGQDVITIADGMSLGVHTLILKLMTGQRDILLRGRKLTIPSDQPIPGEVMFQLEAENSPRHDSDQIFLDPKTYLVKHINAFADGKPIATASVTYSKLGESFDPSTFQFTPPPGSTEGHVPEQNQKSKL